MVTRRGLIPLALLTGGNILLATAPWILVELARAQASAQAQMCEGNDGAAGRQQTDACTPPVPSAESGMGLDAFWKIIEDARSGARDDNDFLKRVNARLRKLKPDELIAFETRRSRLEAEAYSWPLRGAAWLITTGGYGATDDGFAYFLGWLMSQGRTAFENALKDPDTLADLRGRKVQVRAFEEFVSAAQEIYEVKTDNEMPDSVFQTRPDLGERWNFGNDAEMKKRYPRLFAKYRKR